MYDYSLFTKRRATKTIILFVYADNSRNSDFFINGLKFALQNNFKMKYMGDLKYFLCIEIVKFAKDNIMCVK